MKINYCLHTHTYRCGHAEGKDEQYVLSGIKFGLKYLGFTDHVILPKIIQRGMRGEPIELDSYLDSLEHLKKQYSSKITILKGFECEYMPQYVDYYHKLIDSHTVDYLILGQHCCFKNNRVVWYFDLSREEALKQYTEDLIKGMKTGLFLYVAHPDLFMEGTDRWDTLEKECAQKIINASIKYNIPLEINLCHARVYGIRQFAGHLSYYQYPFTPFWEMVAKSKAKVVIGFDAHRPIDVEKPGLEIVEYIVNKTGVKPIYNLTFIGNDIKI